MDTLIHNPSTITTAPQVITNQVLGVLTAARRLQASHYLSVAGTTRCLQWQLNIHTHMYLTSDCHNFGWWMDWLDALSVSIHEHAMYNPWHPAYTFLSAQNTCSLHSCRLSDHGLQVAKRLQE